VAGVKAEDDHLIREQIAYYEARAPEFDQMLVRKRRYEYDGLDPVSPDRDTRELAIAEAALGRLLPAGDVLELACGSGSLTKRLARSARLVTGVDASPAMLALCRERVEAENVRLIESDIFAWGPDHRYDLVAFSFWLSHVPRDLFDPFWSIVEQSLAVRGCVFFIDEIEGDGLEGYEQTTGDDRGTTIRHLEDGRQYTMVKVYYQPAEIERRLGALGWTVRVTPASRIYYAVAARSDRVELA
jgi:demethylmenaquinone methyltransferase/2-methoxy-6-polyprenyl-1,4-benzoquinol methylase